MKLKLKAAIGLMTAFLPFAAHADMTGDHPGYLHALVDLHTARWNLQHRPGEVAVSIQEDRAMSEIDRAIGEIKKAMHDDGKDLDNLPHEESNLDHSGRLHNAMDLLDKAHGDLDQEEATPEARTLKHRSMEHVERAIEATKRAIHDVERIREAVH